MAQILNAAKEMVTGHKGTAPLVFSARSDAEALRECLKGLGTDEKKVIEIVCNRNTDQMQAIRTEYTQLYQRDLVNDIQSEFSGVMQKALSGLAATPTEFDACCVHTAMKGMGTNEDVLIEHLLHRTNVEIDTISMDYKRMYNKALLDELESDLSGDTKKFFTALITNTRKLDQMPTTELKPMCESLYNAGQGRWLGTDENTFIGVLTRYGPSFLRSLNSQYATMYGDSLQVAAKKEMSGTIAKSVDALLTDHDEFYAEKVHESLSGPGTNEDKLVRIVISRRHVLRGINTAFMQKYGKSLLNRVEGDTSGNTQKVLSCIISHYAECGAGHCA